MHLAFAVVGLVHVHLAAISSSTRPTERVCVRVRQTDKGEEPSIHPHSPLQVRPSSTSPGENLLFHSCRENLLSCGVGKVGIQLEGCDGWVLPFNVEVHKGDC